MQYSAALGSRLWGRDGHRHQKKSSTWPEPPTVKLAPLSINRCASDRPLFLAPCPSLSICYFLPSSPSYVLSSRIVFFSLRPSQFYYFFLSVPSPFSSVSLFFFPDCIEHRPLDIETLMQSLSRLWFITNCGCDFSFYIHLASVRCLNQVYITSINNYCNYKYLTKN